MSRGKMTSDSTPSVRAVLLRQLRSASKRHNRLSSGRCVYGGVAEISIYIAAEARGQGVGRQLLQALIAESEAHGIWTLQAGTFEENKASIGLHTQAGFRVIGYRERIGQHHGVWRNTVQMERRSLTVGVG